MTTFVNPLSGSEYEQAWGPWAGTHHHGQNWQSGSAWDLLTEGRRLPVVAPVSGTVVSAGDGGAGRFAGMKIGIQADPMSAFLTHLSAIAVDKGAHVEAGDRIGVSGQANGVFHLHIALGGPDYFDGDDDTASTRAPSSSAARRPSAPARRASRSTGATAWRRRWRSCRPPSRRSARRCG